jgi:hypothetical protein
VLAELFDGAVEGVDGAAGAGDHDAAFHDGEDVGGEGVGVGAFLSSGRGCMCWSTEVI